jgi:translation initiation factor 4G
MPVCKDKPDGFHPFYQIDPEFANQTMTFIPSPNKGRGRRDNQPTMASGEPQPTHPNEQNQMLKPVYGRPTATSQEEAKPTKRIRTKRGKKGRPNEISVISTHPKSALDTQYPVTTQIPSENPSENRWSAMSTMREPVDMALPEVVDRKVKALLNKMTEKTFESLSNHIIDWINKSEDEKNGRTVTKVVHLIFDKSTNLDEVAWLGLYARLCRKMMEKISPRVQDEGTRNAKGKPISGGQVFRKYLLNRCQEEFERNWSLTQETIAPKQGQDEITQKEATTTSGESTLHSDMSYAPRETRKRGLIRFVGELFKLSMLTERIMHEYVKRLLVKHDGANEEDLRLLCELLIAVGPRLDTPKARNHMAIYFARIRNVIDPSVNISPRTRFMLLVSACLVLKIFF